MTACAAPVSAFRYARLAGSKRSRARANGSSFGADISRRPDSVLDTGRLRSYFNGSFPEVLLTVVGGQLPAVWEQSADTCLGYKERKRLSLPPPCRLRWGGYIGVHCGTPQYPCEAARLTTSRTTWTFA